jgi:prolyl 4-hydroxylase
MEPGLPAEPEAWNWLSSDPRVGVCRGFATREECAHLRYLSAGELSDPAAYSRDTRNGAFETAHFKGRARLFGALHSDAVIRTLEARIARHAHCSIAAIEPCSVVVYAPGQSYETHVDFFSAEQLAANRARWNDLSGQRIATFLLCLEAAETGGGTAYPHAGLTVEYETGTAAMHFNVTPDGRADPHSLHRGLPVVRGEKWLLRTTLRERSRYPSDPTSRA